MSWALGTEVRWIIFLSSVSRGGTMTTTHSRFGCKGVPKRERSLKEKVGKKRISARPRPHSPRGLGRLSPFAWQMTRQPSRCLAPEISGQKQVTLPAGWHPFTLLHLYRAPPCTRRLSQPVPQLSGQQPAGDPSWFKMSERRAGLKFTQCRRPGRGYRQGVPVPT